MDDFDADDGFAYEDNWLYVEDDFALADELAESQIADPGYPGTNYEIDLETYEYELYEFWDDMEYADDEYWDYGTKTAVKPLRQQQSGRTGQKRKRDASRTTAQPDKKRKMFGVRAGVRTETEGNYPICFLSMQDQLCMGKWRPPISKTRKPVALLADWRERFPMDENIKLVEMPEDMQRAAASEDEDATAQKILSGADNGMQDGGGDEWDDEGGVQNGSARGSLDLETLKTILRQRMAEAGLQGVDEGELMDTIGKMVNGAGDSDDAAGDLANSLLGQASQGDGTAFTGWLSQQGVSLEDEEEDSVSEEPEEVSTSTDGANGTSWHGQGSVDERAALRGKTLEGAVGKIKLNGPHADESVESKMLMEDGPSTAIAEPTGRTTSSKKSKRSHSITSEQAGGDAFQPPAAKPSLKRKAPTSDPVEGKATSTAQRAFKEPATKRTRSGKSR